MLLDITVVVVILIFAVIPIRMMFGAPFPGCVKPLQIVFNLMTALTVPAGIPIYVSLGLNNAVLAIFVAIPGGPNRDRTNG